MEELHEGPTFNIGTKGENDIDKLNCSSNTHF